MRKMDFGITDMCVIDSRFLILWFLQGTMIINIFYVSISIKPIDIFMIIKGMT